MITGGFYYGGSRAAQHDNVASPFEELIRMTQPVRVLELGTCDGGFSILLRDLLDRHVPEAQLITMDHNQSWVKDRKDPRILYREMDFWSNGSFNEAIVEFIRRPGLSLVLCDGGNKAAEFCEAARYLKVSDIIMGHDYAIDKTYFQEHIEGVVWNWHELQESDIAAACEKYSLVPMMAEEFQGVVWVCKRKTGI